MLTSATDYTYVDTAGIEAAFSGNIIPVADIESRHALFRFEDICYLCEATRVWSYNYINTGLNPTYTGRFKYLLLSTAWQHIHHAMNPDYSLSNYYGCSVYLNDKITEMPVQPRHRSSMSYHDKSYFAHYARDLLSDYTALMNKSPWQSATNGLDLIYQPLDVDVPRLLYWILFQPCWQGVNSSTDSQTEYYDKSYTFCQRGIKSGTGTYHKSSGGVITAYTGPAVNHDYSYVQPDIQTGTRSGRPTYSNPIRLNWYSYYGTVDGQYESGYEYCCDGIDTDAYAYVDFRRDDVLDAYALIEYRATTVDADNDSVQYKFEHLTHESGNRWSFKCFDRSFAKSLMEYVGADFTKVGTRASSRTYRQYYAECWTHTIFVKFDHKYAQGISQQWQWQPE